MGQTAIKTQKAIDDATVDFTIEYKAYIESTFGDPARADILLTEEISKKRFFFEKYDFLIEIIKY